MKNLLVTGGAGFIGSNFVHYILEKYPACRVVVYDKLTYAGNLDNLREAASNARYNSAPGMLPLKSFLDNLREAASNARYHSAPGMLPLKSFLDNLREAASNARHNSASRMLPLKSFLDNREVASNTRYAFVRGDITDAAAVERVIRKHNIDTIVNFAAETHVDRSIMDADAFIQTDVYGTYVLLEAAKRFGLRYHQVGTDEVYGWVEQGASKEADALVPRSPYSASKAGADLLIYAYFVTHNVQATITRGANNIGPYQYPEKAVPLFITNAIDGIPIPLYGDGMQQRDYQYVLDHCEAIDLVLQRGKIGEAYNVGTGHEARNIDMARQILKLLNKPESLIRHVADRPGHDRRYSLDVMKLRALGWEPGHTFEEALEKTVKWYVENEWWWRKIKSGEYREYYRRQYRNGDK